MKTWGQEYRLLTCIDIVIVHGINSCCIYLFSRGSRLLPEVCGRCTYPFHFKSKDTKIQNLISIDNVIIEESYMCNPPTSIPYQGYKQNCRAVENDSPSSWGDVWKILHKSHVESEFWQKLQWIDAFMTCPLSQPNPALNHRIMTRVIPNVITEGKTLKN